MSTLIAYASRYGSTAEIAERIGATMRNHGLTVDVLSMESAPDPSAYDACVIGSGVYASSWSKVARRFVTQNATKLTGRPLWLFSSGPLGGPPSTPPPMRPRSFAQLLEQLGAREHRVFRGALDVSRLRGGDRLIGRFLKQYEGDFREWDQIEAWADGIAAQLEPSPAAVG